MNYRSWRDITLFKDEKQALENPIQIIVVFLSAVPLLKTLLGLPVYFCIPSYSIMSQSQCKAICWNHLRSQVTGSLSLERWKCLNTFILQVFWAAHITLFPSTIFFSMPVYIPPSGFVSCLCHSKLNIFPPIKSVIFAFGMCCHSSSCLMIIVFT